MLKTTSKKKAGRSTKAVTAAVLPLVDGVQAVEIIGENETAIHYRLANGTTAWVPKK